MTPRNERDAFMAIDGTRPARGYASMPRYREPMSAETRVALAVAAVCALVAAAAFVYGWWVVR
jgi:hypothetical protein